MEAKIRREADTLFLSGVAVIAFGIWGAVKICITYFWAPKAWMKVTDVDIDLLYMQIITVVIILVLCFIDIFIRYSIGRPAMEESREIGQGKGNRYLIFAVIYVALDVVGFLSVFIAPGGAGDVSQDIDTMDQLTNILIEASSCYALLQLIVSSLKLRRLRRDAGLI